jgi:hypothetical protein
VTLNLSGDRPLLGLRAAPRTWAPQAIDLSNASALTPFDVTALAVLWARLDVEGRPPEFIEPRDPAVGRYLREIGFTTLTGAKDGTRPGTGDQILIPLTRLAAAEDWDDMLTDLWSTGADLPHPDLVKRMVYILSELIDNATSHGRSAAGTFIAADRHPGGAAISLAVADGGRGIPSHLRLNPRYRKIAEDPELIRLARQPEVTGTRDRRGWGLTEVFEQAGEVGPSQVVIRSGRGQGEFLLRPDQVPYARYGVARPGIPGTWVHVRLGPG